MPDAGSVQVRFTVANAEVVRQALAQLGLGAVRGHGQAVDRADIDARIAFDTQLGIEYRLHITIQAALDFCCGLLRGKAKLHFDIDFLEALLQVHVWHQAPLDRVVVVLVRPLVQAHFAAR